jgi:hypothetical protein
MSSVPTFAAAFIDKDKQSQVINLDLDLYREAESEGISLPQLINRKYPTYLGSDLTSFEQMLLSTNLVVSNDPKTGQRPPSIAQIMSGKASINLMGINAPDGSDALGAGGRFLLPATILQIAESSLMQDNTAYEAEFAGMVGTTVSVSTPRYDTPVVNLNAPRASRSQAIAQGEEPDVMATITVSEVSQRIKTRSIGLKISDEAAKLSALDLVGITLREQSIGERAAALDEDLVAIVNGSTEQGTSALSSQTATSYDATLNNVAGALSHRALMLWLSNQRKYMRITHLIGDLDVGLKIENRSDRPTVMNAPGEGRVDAPILLSMPGVSTPIQFFQTDPALLGANTIIGLDKAKAIRKVVYVGGTYSAVEQMVIRRVTVFRYDYAVRYERIFQDGRGFRKLTLT